MQNYTSSGTSVNRTKLPAVYRKVTLSDTTPFVVDYGCGKYISHIREYLAREGRILYPYDPFNQPKGVNLGTMHFIRVASEHGTEVDVVCSNVLNVIDSDGDITDAVDWYAGVGAEGMLQLEREEGVDVSG